MTLCDTRELCDYFDKTLHSRSHSDTGTASVSPREAINYLLRDIVAYMKASKIRNPFELSLTPEKFAAILKLIQDEIISGKTAKEVCHFLKYSF